MPTFSVLLYKEMEPKGHFISLGRQEHFQSPLGANILQEHMVSVAQEKSALSRLSFEPLVGDSCHPICDLLQR